jgi:hypothetical protein
VRGEFVFMGKHSRAAISDGQTEPQRLISLLESAAKTNYDSNPGLWDEVLTALNLNLCYQPTIAEVLRKGTWRNAANARAYVATAAVRSARGKNLPDYFEKDFRRVESGDPNGEVGTLIDSAAGFDIEDWGGGGIYDRTATGAMRYMDSDDDDYYREIPDWLQRGAEYDAVDWETVAAYAVLKPRMACHLARVLIMRLDLRLGRPEAMSRAANADEATAIEAAWKWIDRNVNDRIAPLFQMAAAPRTLTATEIASYPLLAPGVSLRVDFQLQWDGSRLLLARTGLIPDGDGTFPAFCVEADSEAAAMDTLRLAASEGGDSEIFHFWPLESGAIAVEMSKLSKQGAFAKPWDVLSRVSARKSLPR